MELPKRGSALRGTRGERDLDRTGLAVAHDSELHRVPGLLPVDGALELRRGRDGVPVHRDDDVAAGRDIDAVDGLRAGRRAKTRVLRRRAGPDLGHGDAVLDGRDLDAEVCVLDVAVLDELVDDGADGVRGDREADAVVPARVALDLGVDADDAAARVEQWPARVAVVDRRVGLDRVGDGEVVRRGHLPVQRAYDSRGQRALEAERAADRRHLVTDLEAARA